MTDIVERVARAICRAWFYCDLDKPDGIARWERNQDRCTAEAKAALAVIEPEIEALRQRVKEERAKTLEEAAKVCEHWAMETYSNEGHNEFNAAAKAIRALSEVKP